MRVLDEFVDGNERFFDNKNKSEVLKDKNKEKLYEKICDHPMFAIVSKQEGYRGTNKEEVRCIMCDKKFIKKEESEKMKWLSMLFTNKRLLARYGGVLPSKKPIFNSIESYIDQMERPVEKIRDLYLEYQYEADELIRKGVIPKGFSLEDSFFDYMCEDDYNRYFKDFDQGGKVKVKR